MLLNALRALASQAVVVGHATSSYQQFIWLKPPRAPLIQDIAVAVFFLLSGFLIAYTMRRGIAGGGYTFRVFATDRFARIYSAYLPCLVLVALLDWYVASQRPAFAYAAARDR